MNQQIGAVIPFRTLPSSPLSQSTRDLLVQEMANHLYAAILGGLNTANAQDVIQYLWNAPQRYHHRLVLDHMDDALLEAKQMMIATEMSNG